MKKTYEIGLDVLGYTAYSRPTQSPFRTTTARAPSTQQQLLQINTKVSQAQASGNTAAVQALQPIQQALQAQAAAKAAPAPSPAAPTLSSQPLPTITTPADAQNVKNQFGQLAAQLASMQPGQAGYADVAARMAQLQSVLTAPSALPALTQAEAIQTAQIQAAQAAAAPTPAPLPFTPAAYGGGGGGGGGGGYSDDGGGGSDDSGESEAVRQFREEGIDPFDTDDGGGGGSGGGAADDDGSSDDGGDTSDDGSGDTGSSDDDVQGDAFSSAFTFDPNWVLNPALATVSAYQRFQAAKDAIAPVLPLTAKGPMTQGTASARAAARQSAAQQRLATTRAQLAAFRKAQYEAAQAAAPPPDSTNDQETIMGKDFTLDEVADIFTHSNEIQITDPAPDPIRQRASVHRGAAYIQEMSYPPHGASSGQEGGSVMDEDVLHETYEVLGGDGGRKAYRHGLDVLGAARTSVATRGAKRAGYVVKQTPTGGAYTSLVVNKPKSGDNKASIANARQAGQRAQSVGQKILSALKKPATKVKGAVGAMHAALSVAQVKALAQKAVKAGQAAVGGANTHQTKVNNQTQKLQSGGATIKNIQASGAKGATHFHGEMITIGDDGNVYDSAHFNADDLEILGALHEAEQEDLLWGAEQGGSDEPYEIYGAVEEDDVEIYGSDDEAIEVYGSDRLRARKARFDRVYGDDGTDASAAPTDGSDASTAPATPGGEVAALGPAPTKPPPLTAGLDYTPDPDQSGQGNDDVIYSSAAGNIPPGLIIQYDGSKGLPRYAVGSKLYYMGGNFGGAPAAPNLTGLAWGWDQMGFPDNPNPTRWIDLHGRAGGLTPHAIWYDLTPAQAGDVGHFSQSQGYGPLIGNPNMADFKAMRYDIDTGTWFWFYDTAPAWAKAPVDALRLNQAILDYKAAYAAAAADDAQAAAQATLDAQTAAAQAKQQAAEDAATAHAQQQEEQEAEHQAALLETQQQQQAAEQEREDEAAARQQQMADEAAARQQEMEDARQAAMAPPPGDEGEVDTSDAYSADSYDQGDQVDSGYGDESDQDVMGSERLKRRIAARRGE